MFAVIRGYARAVVLLPGLFSCLLIPAVPSALSQEAPPAYDVLVLHQTQSASGIMGGKGYSMKITSYFAGKAVKHVVEGGGELVSRLDKRRVMIINHEEKTYSDMPMDQIEKLISGFAGEIEAGQAPAKPKAGQAAVPPPLTVTRAGPGETIAGYPTERYLFQGPVEVEIHAAPTLEIDPAHFDVHRLTMPRYPGLNMDAVYQELQKIKGVVLKRVIKLKVNDETLITTTVVDAVERKQMPASFFEIPAGYREVPPSFP